jgi:hypothetical protein
VARGATAAGNGVTKQYGLATVVSLQDERIRKMADGEEWRIPATIEDPTVLDDLGEVLAEMGRAPSAATGA